MSDQKRNSVNSGRINKRSSQNPVSATTIVGSVFVLLVAFVIGLTIRQIRTQRVEPQIVVVPEANETPNEPDIPIIVRPRRAVEVAVKPQPEPVNEEPAQNEQANTRNNQQMMLQNNPRMQDMSQLMSWMSNLTPQEQAQLRQVALTSYISLMQRWQNMPAAQAQAEQAQIQQMIQEWGNLPSDQKMQGIQNIQQQLQQWLQTGP